MNNESSAKFFIDNEQTKKTFLSALVAAITCNPIDIIKAVMDTKALISTARDEILFNNFLTYLQNLSPVSNSSYSCHKLSQILAEVCPNKESGYTGDQLQLNTYAIRLISIIDKAETYSKAVYISNLTRAVAEGFINRGEFFKLCKCINALIDEDLSYLSNDIPIKGTSVFTDSHESTDDFLSTGIIRIVKGGFRYTKRAFHLLAYGLDYENKHEIPNDLPGYDFWDNLDNSYINNLF